MATLGDTPRGLLGCGICGRAAVAGNPPLCTQHEQERRTRVHDGVAAEELDVRWGDTFATWRDSARVRFPELPSGEWRFRHRASDWLLFQHIGDLDLTLGIAGRGVRAHWLVVNARIFVATTVDRAQEIDVWLEVLGVRAAPHAHADNRGAQPADRPQPHPLREVIAASTTPVYGLPDTRLSLHPVGFLAQWSAEGAEVTALSFTNWDPAEPAPGRSGEQLIASRSRLMQAAQDHLQARAGEAHSSHAEVARRHGSRVDYGRFAAVPTRAVELGHSRELEYDLLSDRAMDARLRSNFVASQLYAGVQTACASIVATRGPRGCAPRWLALSGRTLRTAWTRSGQVPCRS